MARKNNARSAQGAGSIRQRPDGRWEARYTAGRDPGTGKQVQRSVYGTTQKEVLGKLKQIHADQAQGAFLEPSRLTVGQWLKIWEAEYLGGVKDSTVYSYKGHIKNHIVPALGAVKLQKLNPHTVQSFYNDLQRQKGLSAKTIKNLHGVLHSALKQAVTIGYIRQNPADNAKLPRCDRPEIQTLPEDALPAFLEAIAGHENEAVFFTTVFTGMRKGEVLGLSWDCVDFERGTLYVKHQLQKKNGSSGGYVLITPKNNKPRTITPAPTVMRQLRARSAQQKRDRLRAGAAWNNPDNLVFTDALGKHLIPETVYKHFKRIVASIGYPALRFHDLRHTYAVNALRGGDDIKSVQDNLGHHTAAFTLDTYGHVTEQMKRDSADRMEWIIQEAKRHKSG